MVVKIVKFEVLKVEIIILFIYNFINGTKEVNSKADDTGLQYNINNINKIIPKYTTLYYT